VSVVAGSLSRLIVVVAASAALACGGSGDGESESPAPAPAPGGAVPIRGTETLAWDQSAPSYQRVRQYRFVLHVDNAAVPLSAVECLDSVSAQGFPCSVRLPPRTSGTHVLRLASIADGLESPLSAPLTVTVAQGRMIVSAVDDPGAGATASGSICLTPEHCFEVHHLVTRPSMLSSPSVFPDGRIAYVEGAREIRTIVEGRVEREPAWTVEDAGARVIAVLVDPDFGRTRSMAVAWTATARRGRVLNIARLSDDNGRLSRPLVIIPEIPVPEGADPPVAQDGHGLIYIAVPASGSANSRNAYEGDVLRFARSGQTWSEGLGSPVLARGFEMPRSLAFDGVGERLWLLGGGTGDGEQLTGVSLRSSGMPADAPRRLDGIRPGAETVAGLVPLSPSPGRAREFIGFDAGGLLLTVRDDATRLIVSARARLGGESVVALNPGRAGRMLVTTKAEGGAVPSFRLYELVPMSPRD
jgi:hypothetical protein